MILIDNHCHFEKLTTTEQQHATQYFHVIGVASNLQSCQQLLTLQQNYRHLSVCLGIHPEESLCYNEFEEVAKLIRVNRQHIVGIGEIGLPYFSLSHQDARSRMRIFHQGYELFEQFISLAGELELPVNLHCVGESTLLAIDCLKHYRIKRALFHWFAGSKQAIAAIEENGWCVSVSPDVIANNDYQQVVKTMPLSILCLESDGPWLYQGKRGAPDMMLDTARYLAALYQKDVADIVTIHQNNSQRLWQLGHKDG